MQAVVPTPSSERVEDAVDADRRMTRLARRTGAGAPQIARPASPRLRQRRRRRAVDRLADQPALDLAAAEPAHAVIFAARLRPFGDRRHAERIRHRDDRADDRDALRRIARRAAHEAAIDLDGREAALAQIAERRAAGAEIVERDAHAERQDAIDHLGHRIAVLDEHLLGDLQFQPVGQQAAVRQRRDDRRGAAAGRAAARRPC